MNFIDIILLVPLIWGLYKGFSKGLVVEVASLLALILGVWCAVHFSEFAASVLVVNLGFNISDSYLSAVSFAVTFLVVALAIVFVSRIIDKLLSAVALGGVNKFLGAIFGGAKAFLLVAILLFFVNQLDQKMHFIGEEKKVESLFYNPMVGLIEEWLPKLDIEKIKNGIKDEMPEMDNNSKETVV